MFVLAKRKAHLEGLNFSTPLHSTSLFAYCCRCKESMIQRKAGQHSPTAASVGELQMRTIQPLTVEAYQLSHGLRRYGFMCQGYLHVYPWSFFFFSANQSFGYPPLTFGYPVLTANNEICLSLFSSHGLCLCCRGHKAAPWSSGSHLDAR